MQGTSAIRSIRPGTWGDTASRATTSPSGQPSPRAHAAAARALLTLKSPSSGSDASDEPKQPSRRKRLPDASSATPVARTSAAGWRPKLTRGTRDGMMRHASSSRFTTSTPCSPSSVWRW